MMKRFFPLFLFLMTLVSCGPSKHVMYVDMRYPSKSGVDLGGKIPSVVYLDSENDAAGSFAGGMATTFASALEQDLGTGEGSVGVYRIFWQPDVDYADRNSLLDLLVDTGADVVFLFDKVELGQSEATPSSISVPFTMKLYCLDGMDKSQQVRTFAGSSRSGIDGHDAGKAVSESFKTIWKTEPYSLAYFDSEKWYLALDKAEAYDWKGAMDQWFTLLESNDPLRRSCAEYNIATACYMLGDYSLALQWLDRSDADNKLPNMSDTLRKRIESRK
jgi:hypothetical protein